MTLRKRMIKKISRFKTAGYTFLLVPFVIFVVVLTTDTPYFCLLLPGIVCAVIGIDSLMSANYLKKRWRKELSLEKECPEPKSEKKNWHLNFFQDENIEMFKLISNYFGCIL